MGATTEMPYSYEVEAAAGHSEAYIAETRRHRDNALTELNWANDILVQLHERAKALKGLLVACDTILETVADKARTDG